MPPPDVGVHNTTGAVTRRYTDPYGNPRGTTPTAWAGDHGFLDKPTDTTGLTAIGARYYDSLIARFVSVDPVMDLTDPQQWNAYAYANGNPLTWSDPTGLWPDWLDDAASAVGDGISTAWNATTTWVDEHQADIVAGVAGAVVGGGCLLLTAGWGSVACGALGGAAAGAATHAWRAQVQHTEEFSWGALGREALIGGTTGAATAGIGNALRPLTSRASAAVSSAFRRPPTPTQQAFRGASQLAPGGQRGPAVSLDQVRQCLGRCGMSVARYDIRYAPTIIDNNGRAAFGVTSMVNGRPVIQISNLGLRSRNEAVQTIFHEVAHANSYTAFGHGGSERAAEAFGTRMLNQFLRRAQ